MPKNYTLKIWQTESTNLPRSFKDYWINFLRISGIDNNSMMTADTVKMKRDRCLLEYSAKLGHGVIYFDREEDRTMFLLRFS